MSMHRLFIIGRQGYGPEAMFFYHWLAVTLGQNEAGPPPVDQLQIPMLPNPEAPVTPDWVNGIHHLVGMDPAERARTIFVAHGVGALAVVRYAAALPAGNPIGGLLAVGGWWTVDDVDDVLRPWIERPLNLENARANLPRVISLISDDDPDVPDHAANAALWRERLDADVRVLPNEGQFDHPIQPDVLAALKELLGMT